MTDRWDQLFDDMAAQVDASDAHERMGQQADLVEEAFAERSLAERLSGAQGKAVTLWVEKRGIGGVVDRCGKSWVVLSQESRTVLVMLAHVELVRMTSRVHSEPGMMSPMSVLRAWGRERIPVRVEFAGGFTEGSIDAVGSDYVQLRSGGEFDVVPLSGIRAVWALTE